MASSLTIRARRGGTIKSWADVYSGEVKDRIGKIDKSNEQIWRTALSLGYKYGPLSDEQWHDDDQQAQREYGPGAHRVSAFRTR